MRRTSFDQVIAGLDRVLALCRRIGLSSEVDDSRFLNYRQRLQQLLDRHEQSESQHRPPTGDSGREGMILGATQVESLELAGLASFLETYDPDVLRPKLRWVLKGPPVPIDEDQDSNQARNFMFELSLAEKLSRAGLRPELGEHPDLQCEINGTTLFIECKRPLSLQKVGKRISEAYKQLNRELKARPQARGIIAVSLSKPINRGDTFLEYSDEAKAKAFLGEELERLAGRSGAAQRRLPASIIGMLFHAMTPAVQRETRLMVYAEQVNVEVRARKGTPDYRAVRRMYAALAAAAEHRPSYLSHEEARSLFDRQARELLNMSGEDFVRRYNAGELDSRLEEPAVRRLEMLLPLGR